MSFRLNLPPLFRRMDEIYAYLTREINRLNYALSFLDVPEASASAEIRAEDLNNKSATISYKSTNTQYPTSKAVYDYAVPQTRTVNDKALSGNIVLDASDVGAVPTDREINGHALTEDLTLTPADLGEGDFVTEKGTSGNWVWRKWNSGTAECWGMHETNIASGGLASSGNVYSLGTTVAFPTGFFVSVENIQASIRETASANACWVGHYANGGVTEVRYSIFRGNQLTSSMTFFVDIYAIGRWKE